jgi:predicted GNAT family acetyltransferase
MSLSVTHNIESNQFVATVDGKVSTLEYSISQDKQTLDYYSTYVPTELRGRQIGQDMVLFALNYAKEHRFKVKPTCPFVKRIVDLHPEFQSLLAK